MFTEQICVIESVRLTPLFSVDPACLPRQNVAASPQIDKVTNREKRHCADRLHMNVDHVRGFFRRLDAALSVAVPTTDDHSIRRGELMSTMLSWAWGQA